MQYPITFPTNLLSRFLNLTIHQEVPKLFSQQERRGLVAKALAYKTYVQQEFEPAAGKGLDLKNLLSRFLNLTIHQEVPKLFSQEELRGRVDKTPAQQSKDRQFESSRFQDRRGNEHKRHLVAAWKTTKIKQQNGSVDKVPKKKKKNIYQARHACAHWCHSLGQKHFY
jgi:hypothetical protein